MLVLNVVSQRQIFNPLTLNDPYSGRTAPLTFKSCILYIYSTNLGTEYFKHGINSPFFYLQNSVWFIILTYLVPVLVTFYIQGRLKLKKSNSGTKRIIDRKPLLVRKIRTNRMHYLLLIYFNNRPVYVSSRLAAHHQ